MKSWRNQPVILEIPAFVLVKQLSVSEGKEITIGTIPDLLISKWSEMGFDAVWLMGVWQRSPEACRIARELPELKNGYENALKNYSDEDIVGSPYAIYAYLVDERLGTNAELLMLRDRMHAHNLRLILDFVPNHLSIDHPWIAEHPEYFVTGTADVFAARPDQFFETNTDHQPLFFAYGKEGPYKSWTDTVQLDYRKQCVHTIMSNILLSIATYCDGLRCDMAMLILKNVFLKTWGTIPNMTEDDFWVTSIALLRTKYPDFLLIAEAYWNTEYTLQQQGFDAVYDGVLRERLMKAAPLDINVLDIRLHLDGSPDFQKKLLRYVENHDEDRAITVGKQRSKAATVLALTVPGVRLIHDGEMEGFLRHLPIQLSRRFEEECDDQVYHFFKDLLRVLREPIFHEGFWSQLKVRSVWSGTDETNNNIIAHLWSLNEQYVLVIVNYSAFSSKGFVELSGITLENRYWVLTDLLGPSGYQRCGNDLTNQGLYVDVGPFAYHLFALSSG